MSAMFTAATTAVLLVAAAAVIAVSAPPLTVHVHAKAAGAAAASPTSRHVIDTRNHAPPHWTLVQRTPPHKIIHFHLALPQRNLHELERRFWAVSNPESPSYRQFMSISDIDQLISTPQTIVNAVTAWVQPSSSTRDKSPSSTTVTSIQHFSDAMQVTTTVRHAEQLFQTKLYTFKHHTEPKTHVAVMGAYSVPSALVQSIELVTGLFQFPVPRSSGNKKNKADPVDPQIPAGNVNAIVPETCQHIYKVPENGAQFPSANMSQGVIEFAGESFSPSDLAEFAQQTSVHIPALLKQHIVGDNTPAQPGVEASLDIQYIAGIAQNIDSWFWLGDNYLYEFGLHFYMAEDVPLVISISYAWAEAEQCRFAGNECFKLGVNSYEYVARVNVEFQKIGLRGVSIFTASGDSGANGRTDELCLIEALIPAFPACSPYVTAVGATQFNNPTALQNGPKICQTYPCVGGGDEVAVTRAHANFASGGGFSNVAPMPDYQKDAVQAYFSSGVTLPPAKYYNATGRGYPDLAAIGTGVYIDFKGSNAFVGGTSASTPIVAGIWSLLNDVAMKKTGRPLGFLNPLLYKIHKEQPSSFHDITVGDNKCTETWCGLGQCQGYECTKGWDPVSGLGSPVYTELLAYLEAHIF